MVQKIIHLGLVISMAIPGYAQSVRQERFQELSVDSTRDFSQETSQTSIAQKMVLFDMPEEYRCPLFSNSPYSEILGAIDQMQSELNKVFPQCENKAMNDQMSRQSGQLRDKIMEVQKLVESGQVYKLNSVTQSALAIAQQLQQTLSSAAQAQTKVCYRSNQNFRNVIFSMNETFQALAPVVLDFVKSNPLLAQSMGPTLKILTGAEQISKGIGLIEQIAKDSVMFDMTDKDNRVNTIKNVCQFMKLYRRVQYLRLSKLEQTRKMQSEFQKKIEVMNQNLSIMKSQADSSSVGASAKQSNMSSQGPQLFSINTDPTFDLYQTIQSNLNNESQRVQKALSDLEMAKEQLNNPLITQCQTVHLVRKQNSLRRLIADVVDFDRQFGVSSDIERLSISLNEYMRELDETEKSKDKSQCVSLGQDWLKLVSQMLIESRKKIASYEVELSQLNGDQFVFAKKRIALKEKEIQNEKSNYESLKTLVNIAAFESAELEKRFKDMHRYLFKGPDFNEIKASCEEKETSDKCSVGTIKAAYQWYRNNGPVYELLKNDEQFFDLEYNKVQDAIRQILYFEQGQVTRENGGKAPQTQAQFEKFILKTYELSHLNNQVLPIGSNGQIQMCRQANIAINSYMKATEYLASSESLCNMIYPALDAETNISQQLLAYCQPVGSSTSKIQSQIMKMVGFKKATDSKSFVYQSTTSNSMKAFVDKLIQKYQDMNCEQKTGF